MAFFPGSRHSQSVLKLRTGSKKKIFFCSKFKVNYRTIKKVLSLKRNKASQAIQSPRTVPFFLLVSLLDGYSFPNVLVKGTVAFKH